MLVDKVKIEVSAGKGGDGVTSFHREKYVASGAPDGGDGGAGGNIIVRAFNGVRTLRLFRSRTKVKSECGGDGARNRKSGKSASSEIIQVPVGTIVRDAETGMILADLKKDGEEIIVAQGGRGGRGNIHFVNSIHRSPKHSELGQPGEKRAITLELKLLADVGLVGLPNAGKSSLLSRISGARPKVADFPFSTVEPMLGVVFLNHAHEGYVVADLPGLIEGAHEGKGLGVYFLKHIERARLLLHLVDLNSETLVEDFLGIREELASYEDGGLARKPFVVAGTKTDLLVDLSEEFSEAEIMEISSEDGEDLHSRLSMLKKACIEAGLFKQKAFKNLFDESMLENSLFHEISSANGDGIDEMLQSIGKLLDKVNYEPPAMKQESAVFGEELLPFMVEQIEDAEWSIKGKKVEDLAAMTRFEERESVMRFHKKLDKMGILDELSRQGAKSGDLVHIGDLELFYEPDY